MPPHRVGFLLLFGLKTGIDFAQFVLESGVVFEGTTGVYERIYRFNSKWVRKKEKYANSKWIWRIFCLRSNLGNDNIISANRPGLKTGMDFRGLVWKLVWKIKFCWSEIRSETGKQGGIPLPRIPMARSTPGILGHKIVFETSEGVPPTKGNYG